MTTVSSPPSPNTPPEALAGHHAMDLNSPATESVRSEAARMPQNNSWGPATQPEYPMLPFNPWHQTQSPYVQHNPFSQLQLPQMPPIASAHQMYQQQLFQAMNPMYPPAYYQQQSVTPDRFFMPPGFPAMPRPMEQSTRRSPGPNPAGLAVTLSADATTFRDNLLRQAADPDLLEKAAANEKRMLAAKLAEEQSAKAATTAREEEERLKTEKEAATTKPKVPEPESAPKAESSRSTQPPFNAFGRGKPLQHVGNHPNGKVDVTLTRTLRKTEGPPATSSRRGLCDSWWKLQGCYAFPHCPLMHHQSEISATQNLDMTSANQCFATKSGKNCEGKGKCTKVHQEIARMKEGCSHKTLDDLLQDQSRPETTSNAGTRTSTKPGPARPIGGPWMSLRTNQGPEDSWCQAIWELLCSKGLHPAVHVPKNAKFQSMYHNSSKGEAYHMWRLALTEMTREGVNHSRHRPSNEDISVTFIHVTSEAGIGGILNDRRIKSMNEPSGKQWSTIYGQACLITKGKDWAEHNDTQVIRTAYNASKMAKELCGIGVEMQACGPQRTVTMGGCDEEQSIITASPSTIIHNKTHKRWIMSEWSGLITALWIFREPTFAAQQWQPGPQQEAEEDKAGSFTSSEEPSTERPRKRRREKASSSNAPAASRRDTRR